MQSLQHEFDIRLTAFQESYEWEECDGLVRPLALAGDLIESAFEPVTAARAMHALRQVLSTAPESEMTWSKLDNEEPTLEWRAQWEDIDAYNDTFWPETMERAHDLHAFAYYGILPSWSFLSEDGEKPQRILDSLDVPAFVTGTIENLTGFLSLFGPGSEFYGLEAIQTTCLAAAGRLKYDNDEPITVHELAALSRVTTKRLQNAIYAKSADAPIVSRDGLIAPASAESWLTKRDYMPSIWKEYLSGECWKSESNDIAPKKLEEPEEYLFVPEARDGTIFGPKSCLRPGRPSEEPHYTIGAKGEEQDYENFGDALSALTTMATPRWRRPNDAGNFGIVTVERWRRVSARELSQL
ncbi:hypothetical protein EKJ_26390 [Qipengyuania flava]|uniref:Uncharacterized protein n=1 Tax=Qipengyuania flava TaxID=192812 RepID=A0A3T1CLG1_9SPHN|nr:hypothetical protein [Qipengyuania flava]BBI21792.1 hypothetical protein EKJ_26390 [Qipengyuania flava]